FFFCVGPPVWGVCWGAGGGAGLILFRARQSRSPSVLYGAWPGGEIQSQEPDRRGHLSRLGRALRLGIRQLAASWAEARYDRARRRAGLGDLADSVSAVRTGPRAAGPRATGPRATGPRAAYPRAA